MSQKHDTQSNPFEFKQKDINQKQHEFADDQLYPSSTDDMTCWEKFKNAWNNFINRSIDYFEFDRLFNCEGEQKIEINKCYKRFLENYDETYSERQIRFAYTFEYVLEEKIKQQSRKQKHFFQELYRFFCCEGGNQMVEIEEAYKSDREYQRIVRKKLIEKKQMFQQMLKKQIEEEKEKEIQLQKKEQEKKIRDKVQSKRKKKEYDQNNKQNPQEFISYEDFCFEEDDAKNNKIEKVAQNEVKQITKLKADIVRVRQNEHQIFQNQSQLNISQKTQKKKSTPTTMIKSTKQTQQNQEFIDYHDDLDDLSHQDNKKQRMVKGANTSSAKNQIITKNIITTTTHQNIINQNHAYDQLEEADAKKQKKRKQNPVQQNAEFQGTPTNNIINRKSKEFFSTNKFNQQNYQQPNRNNFSNDRQYSNFQAYDQQPTSEYQYSIKQGKQFQSSQNFLNEQSERNNKAHSRSSFPENESNNYSQDKQNNSTRKNQTRNLENYKPSYQNHIENAQISHQKYNNNKNSQGRNQLKEQPINLKNQKPSPLIYNEKNQNNQVYDTQILSPGKHRQQQQLQISPKINNDEANVVFDQFQEVPKTNLSTSQKKRKSKKQQDKDNEGLQDQRQFDGLESTYQNNKLDNQKQGKIQPALKAKKAKKADFDEQAEDNIQIQIDDLPQTYQGQPTTSLIAKKMKKKSKNIKNPNEKDFDNQIDVIDDYQIEQNQSNQENFASKPQMVIKKRKAKKNIMKKDVSDDQIEIDNEITKSTEQPMKPKWNTIDVNNFNQSENAVQASKKRRNKKQLRNNEDDLKIDEVIFQGNNEFGQVSNHQEQEIGGSSFVKAEKKRKKGRQIRERQDQDEQIIQIDF